MRKKIKILMIFALAAIIGLSMAACGGGAKSSTKDNQYLGALPRLNADYTSEINAPARKKAADTIKKLNDNANTMNDLTKVDTMEKKEQKVLDDLKSKFEEAEKAEWNKIDGKDVPFTTSDAFNQLPIQIDSLKLSAKEKGLIVSVTARKDFTINTPNKDNSYENFGKLYYRILAIDGSIISSGVAGLVSVVHLPKSYKQSGVMDPARISLNISEKPNWANFSSLEFVTTVELK